MKKKKREEIEMILAPEGASRKSEIMRAKVNILRGKFQPVTGCQFHSYRESKTARIM